MPSDDNKASCRRYNEIDNGNLDATDELAAENYLDHSPPPFVRVCSAPSRGPNAPIYPVRERRALSAVAWGRCHLACH